MKEMRMRKQVRFRPLREGQPVQLHAMTGMSSMSATLIDESVDGMRIRVGAGEVLEVGGMVRVVYAAGEFVAKVLRMTPQGVQIEVALQRQPSFPSKG